MAKVRIQARSIDADDASADGDRQSGDKQNRSKGRQAGAVDILARVWQREGVSGWYQVCRTCLFDGKGC
jgi:adenine nucleotide transporter 17